MNTQALIDKMLDKTVAAPNGCRIFTGAMQSNGYCRVSHEGKSQYAHRVMYKLVHGYTPSGFDICHSCDWRSCINPQHLFLGTRKENMADAVSKGRQAKGAKMPHFVMTPEIEAQLVLRAKNGDLYKDIAKDIGICPQHAALVARRNGIHRKPRAAQSI